jgi:hypothetical protein
MPDQAPPLEVPVSRRLTLISSFVAVGLVAAWSSTGHAAPGNSIPDQLARIEAAVTELLGLVPPPPTPPTAYNRTRLLIPFVTNQAGFDTGVAVVNTGLDSSGQVGSAGACAVHYFGRVGSTPVSTTQTTSQAVAPGDSFTFVLSTGGALGVNGLANFQGYLEIDCAFPFGHGFSFISDGPIGAARVASSSPALVLPRERTNTQIEGLGQ